MYLHSGGLGVAADPWAGERGQVCNPASEFNATR